MSMHEIESLVEYSVLAVAAAEPTPKEARNIVHSLYLLQDQFDCGYTLLRTQQELEKLNYLFMLPPENLPEPERGEAMALRGEGGFFGKPSTYYYQKAGRACVTAGSPLWEKLCQNGTITGEGARPVHELPLLELAHLTVPLLRFLDQEIRVQAQGLWYTLFPVFSLIMLDEEDDETLKQVLALRDLLATPEAFSFCEESPDIEDKMDAEWFVPYLEWRQSGGVANDQERREKIMQLLGQQDFRAACALADGLPDDQERLYFRAVISLKYYQSPVLAGGKRPPDTDAFGLLSLPGTREALTSLIGKLTGQDWGLGLSLACCDFLLDGDYEKAFGVMARAFEKELYKVLETKTDERDRQFFSALYALTFYQAVDLNLPAQKDEKRRLMKARAGTLLSLPEAKEAFLGLRGKKPESDWSCLYNCAICCILMGDGAEARTYFEQAAQLNPNNPAIPMALEQLDQTMQGRSPWEED